MHVWVADKKARRDSKWRKRGRGGERERERRERKGEREYERVRKLKYIFSPAPGRWMSIVSRGCWDLAIDLTYGNPSSIYSD